MIKNLITVSGPRGAGKDTLISEVIETLELELHRIVPCTTRGPRPGEIHTIHQYFISEEEFNKKEKADKFVFTNPPNSSGYRSGTLKTELTHDLSIVDITAKGANVLRQYMHSHNGKIISFFLFADYETRFGRLQLRHPDLDESGVHRLMSFDPTDQDPNRHPDWFIKKENRDGYLKQTVQKVCHDINEFMEKISV